MAKSKRLKALEREISLLRAHFLPVTFDPLGTYPEAPKVQSRARAFLVLVHAEIESFFEEWAKEIARASEELWKTKSRASAPFNFILATHAEQLTVPNAFVAGAKNEAPARFAKNATDAFQRYYKALKDNNGVKEHNFLALFTPLGVEISQFSATLLTNLESFGADRGDHAHHSVQAVLNPLDPETEYDRVQTLMSDLEGLDTWLVACKRRIR